MVLSSSSGGRNVAPRPLAWMQTRSRVTLDGVRSAHDLLHFRSILPNNQRQPSPRSPVRRVCGGQWFGVSATRAQTDQRVGCLCWRLAVVYHGFEAAVLLDGWSGSTR